MDLIVMVLPDNDLEWEAPEEPAAEVVFQDVDRFGIEGDFFVVHKKDGEQHGVRAWRIESYKTINN